MLGCGFVVVSCFLVHFGIIPWLSRMEVISDSRNRLVREASIHAKQTGERNISPRSVRKVREVYSIFSFPVWRSESNNSLSEMLEEIQGLTLLFWASL
jgi:hypothetical protein